VQGVGLNQALLKTIKENAGALSEKRNLLAHGIWTFDQHAGWVVRQTKGSWPEDHPQRRGRKRSIEPESVPVNVEGLHQIVVEIDGLIADVKKLHQTLRE
jgi:hypothetical protein